MRTDWYKRNASEAKFLNADDKGPHSPGPTAETIHYLVAKGVIGWGSETVGTDAGSAGGMDPPFPAHTFMHKANRYGLASLCQLDKLPPKGAILIAAPLKIVKGTGSPCACWRWCRRTRPAHSKWRPPTTSLSEAGSMRL